MLWNKTFSQYLKQTRGYVHIKMQLVGDKNKLTQGKNKIINTHFIGYVS